MRFNSNVSLEGSKSLDIPPHIIMLSSFKRHEPSLARGLGSLKYIVIQASLIVSYFSMV